MTPDEMKRRKIELGLTNRALAERSGVPIGTINKIFCGATKAPRKDTLLALESALAPPRPYGTDSQAFQLKEPDPAYAAGTNPVRKMPGEYTLDDYLSLPDDQRVELIDGYFYDMAAPHFLHQMIAIQIGHQLMSHVERIKGPCKPVLSPIDVQLDRDNKTVVQPDVIILCDPLALVKNGRVFGAPDFVIEILSPSTQKKDLTLKLAKYSAAGVRELWYVDPNKQLILVYDLENEELPVIYSFRDKVPVIIWGKDFSVDFNSVYEYIKDSLE